MAKEYGRVGSVKAFELNEVSTWEEWREYQQREISVGQWSGDLNDLGNSGKVWFEAATSTNNPTDMTQGIIDSSKAFINGVTHISQIATGRNNAGNTAPVVSRYYTTSTGWTDWA